MSEVDSRGKIYMQQPPSSTENSECDMEVHCVGKHAPDADQQSGIRRNRR